MSKKTTTNRRVSSPGEMKRRVPTDKTRGERGTRSAKALAQDGSLRPPAHSGAWVAEGFWQEKTLEQLAAEQGVKPIARLEEVLGKGADLWENDLDFENFVQGIYDRRREDREPNRR